MAIESPTALRPAPVVTPPYPNVMAWLTAAAARCGERRAMVSAGSDGSPTERPVTFAELEQLAISYATGLSSIGLTRGMRVLLMVRPGVDFVALMFGLFRCGAVPVLIDPGMGAARLLECVRGVEPEGFVGIPIAHMVRLLRRGPFRNVRHVVTVGRRWGWGGVTLKELARSANGHVDPSARNSTIVTSVNDTAAILFTSGSTGPAKGVVYTHGMFDAQIRAIQSHFAMTEDEIDLPGFAPFALFSIAMGMTVILPKMDFSRPARVNPANVVRAVETFKPSNATGSPAMWNRVSAYCIDRGITLTSLRRVLLFGAPISDRLINQVRRILQPNADVHTPYGATEALPVASISGSERVLSTSPLHSSIRSSEPSATCSLLSVQSPGGLCVGRSVGDVTIRIIGITDEPVVNWSERLTLSPGEIGEIVVTGPVVTKAYFQLADANLAAKILDGDRVWHRMGDLGWIDAGGRLWFCGRKAHRVVTEDGTLFSIPCETVFNAHPDVIRSALVGIGPQGRQTPLIVIEPVPGKYPRSRRNTAAFREQLTKLARSNERTHRIAHFLFHRSFPVDARHNTKINREALAVWAARRMP